MSHKLKNIHIKNFKSIIDCDFEFSDFTPLVGYNNAGKSNIIAAVKWFLKKSNLPVDSFYDKNEDVIVEGCISGIDANLLALLDVRNRNSIAPYIHNHELHMKRIQAKADVGFGAIRLFIKDFTKIGTPDEWAPNPAGIDNAISSLFPEPIHIGAMENSEEDISKSKNTTTIGKLLQSITDIIENNYSSQAETSFDHLKQIIDANGSNRATELIQFDSNLNSKVTEFFPGVSVKVHIPLPDLKDIFKSGTLKIFEPNNPSSGRDVSMMGHGAQRSIQMALIRHLADLRGNSQISRTLLLIDEPELYLHPQAIEVLRYSLKKLSQAGYQVIISTHSPMMIKSDDMPNALLIRKSQQRGTYRKFTLKNAIPQVTQNASHQLELMFSLTNSSQILFSEKVILTEGKTEHRILPVIFEKIKNESLAYNKIALIAQGGVTNTKKSMDVLNVLDLPTKAIVDLDYVFTSAINDGFLQQSDPDIVFLLNLLSSIATSNGITLNVKGLPTNKNSNVSAAEAYELLAAQATALQHIDSLHLKLKAHNVWLWKKGSIELHLNIPGKNEAAWSSYVHGLNIHPIQTIVPDFNEINDLVNWICS